jgi:hypothetical protein
VGGRRFTGLFESLEADFHAAEDRAEREEADDLAMSLRQDRLARQVLARGGWEALSEHATPRPIDVVGADYVEAGGCLIPLGRLTAKASSGDRRPLERDDSLLERLRAWAREGSVAIRLHTPMGAYEGRLRVAGRDHLLMDARGSEVLIPYSVLETVSRLGGS